MIDRTELREFAAHLEDPEFPKREEVAAARSFLARAEHQARKPEPRPYRCGDLWDHAA